MELTASTTLHAPPQAIIRAVDPATARVVPFVRLAFYLYVASFPFEIEDRPIPIEIPTLTGCLFLLAALLQPGVCFRALPKGFWWMMTFFAVYVISGLASGFQYPQRILQDYFRMIQLLVLFWTGYSLIRHDRRIGTTAAMVLAGSSLIRALLQVLGIGTTTLAGRVQVFGQDQNASAGIMAVGLLIWIGLSYARPRSLIKPAAIILPFVAVLGIAVVQTGSRGALVALLAGLMCFVFSASTLRRQLTIICAVVVAVLALVLVTLGSPTMRERWLLTVQKGDFAKREQLFPIFLNMFYEKPLWGWGPYSNTKEGARRLRLPGYQRISPHNLPQELLTATGLVGTIPMAIAIAVMIGYAWKARHGPEGTLPLALLACVLVHNLSLDLLRAKLLWFIFAYVSASGSVIIDRLRRCAPSGQQVLN